MGGEIIKFATGTQAALDAADPDFLEASRAEDTGRVFVGSLVSGHRVRIATPYTLSSTGSITGAGNTTLEIPPWASTFTWRLDAGNGSGAYTFIVVLPTLLEDMDGNAAAVAPAAGDRIDLLVSVTNSANPTLEFRNASTGGALLLTINGDAGQVRLHTLTFLYVSNAWELFTAGQLNA